MTATGGYYAPGIGAGMAYYSGCSSTCGAITISGGTVTATGGDSAPGIGAGTADDSGASTCGEITFEGGTVTATAGSGAPTAIGKGKVYSGTSSTKAIVLQTNCNVTMKNPNVTDSDPDTQNFLDTGDAMYSVCIGGSGYPIMSPKTVMEFDVPGALAPGFTASYDVTNKSWHVWYF